MRIGPRELQILRALEDAGNYGVYGPPLSNKTWRFGSAIHILRKKGFPIKSIHVRGRIWLYVLQINLPTQRRLFE